MENKPLCGIIPPLVTPLKDNETLDVESLERLIEHLISGGVHGLFILGTTGEEQSLSYTVRKEMIVQSARINRGRLPLLVCISDTSIVESIRLAGVAADNGADGVVSAETVPAAALAGLEAAEKSPAFSLVTSVTGFFVMRSDMPLSVLTEMRMRPSLSSMAIGLSPFRPGP